MKSIATWLIITSSLFVVGLTLPYFIIGIEFLFLPILIIIWLLGLSGVVTIPISLFRYFKKLPQNKWLIRINGIALGLLIGYFIIQPIDNWDERARNASGRIISQELEFFKNRKGEYPKTLTQLDTLKLERKLPRNYKLDRFTYYLDNKKYWLEIPIPITDRWQWDQENNNWVYR